MPAGFGVDQSPNVLDMYVNAVMQRQIVIDKIPAFTINSISMGKQIIEIKDRVPQIMKARIHSAISWFPKTMTMGHDVLSPTI